MTGRGETMQGRRVPDGTDTAAYQPGDYGKRGATWWVCLPTGVLGRLDERWTTVEHDDSGGEAGPTITVVPSIFDSPLGWHGWLDHGVWRSV